MTDIEEAYAQWRDQRDEEPSLREAFEAGARVQPPTREQVETAVEPVIRRWFDAGGSLRTMVTDAVLALFPQPTPSAEPTAQVPVVLIQQIDRALGEDAWHPEDCPGSHPAYCTCAVGQARRALRGMLAQDVAPTEPVSIADMAPGTTFVEAVPWTVVDADAVHDQGAGLRYRGLGTFDPSTIRDVTQPPA